MSSIDFSALQGEVSVQGRQYTSFILLAQERLLEVFNLKSDALNNLHPLRLLFPDDHYMSSYLPPDWATRMETFVNVGHMTEPKTTFMIGDRETNFGTAGLNTLLQGSDTEKLAARIAGQCELHAYVEGKNRKWLARLILNGLDSGLFYNDVGWQKVVGLLHSSYEGPVVMSFSGSGTFPEWRFAYDYGGWQPSGDMNDEEYDAGEEWLFELTKEQAWEYAVKALRNFNKDNRVELSPDDWKTFHFRTGVTGQDIMAHCAGLQAS